jgi:thiol:disulfide interchange protein
MPPALTPMEDPDYGTPVTPIGQGGTGKWMAIIALAVLAGFGAYRWQGPSSAMAAWTTDWDKGLQTFETTGKPILALFTADWCPACKDLESSVLCDSNVYRRLNSLFTLVKVDLTDRGGPGMSSAQTYNVRGIPTLILFDNKGRELDRMTGGRDAASFLQWAEDGHRRATEAK